MSHSSESVPPMIPHLLWRRPAALWAGHGLDTAAGGWPRAGTAPPGDLLPNQATLLTQQPQTPQHHERDGWFEGLRVQLGWVEWQGKGGFEARGEERSWWVGPATPAGHLPCDTRASAHPRGVRKPTRAPSKCCTAQ
eukprot:scaffold495_cov19-Tisochrysis_lutea.AAC.2